MPGVRISPLGPKGQNPPLGILVFCSSWVEIRKSKCNCPADSCWSPAGWRPHLNLSSLATRTKTASFDKENWRSLHFWGSFFVGSRWLRFAIILVQSVLQTPWFCSVEPVSTSQILLFPLLYTESAGQRKCWLPHRHPGRRSCQSSRGCRPES